MCECQRPVNTPRQPSRVCVGAVRIALLVGEGVMATVVGDPVDDRALQTSSPGSRAWRAAMASSLEGAMGEHAMEADGHAESDEYIGDGQDQKVASGDRATPEQPQRRQEAGKGQDDGDDGDAALEAEALGCDQVASSRL